MIDCKEIEFTYDGERLALAGVMYGAGVSGKPFLLHSLLPPALTGGIQ